MPFLQLCAEILKTAKKKNQSFFHCLYHIILSQGWDGNQQMLATPYLYISLPKFTELQEFIHYYAHF